MAGSHHCPLGAPAESCAKGERPGAGKMHASGGSDGGSSWADPSGEVPGPPVLAAAVPPVEGPQALPGSTRKVCATGDQQTGSAPKLALKPALGPAEAARAAVAGRTAPMARILAWPSSQRVPWQDFGCLAPDPGTCLHRRPHRLQVPLESLASVYFRWAHHSTRSLSSVAGVKVRSVCLNRFSLCQPSEQVYAKHLSTRKAKAAKRRLVQPVVACTKRNYAVTTGLHIHYSR